MDRGVNVGYWVFVDQAIISAANLFTMVMLARELGTLEYGRFVLAFMVIYFVNTVQSALITQPHNVLGSNQTDAGYRRYTKATAITQIAFALTAGVIIALIAGYLSFNRYDSDWVSVIFALAPTVVIWQLHEFVRRILFTEQAEAFVTGIDLIAYCGQIGILVMLWKTQNLTSNAAVLAIGLGSLCGLSIGAWRIRTHMSELLDRSDVLNTLLRNWNYGRWLLGGMLAFWLSSQMYPLVTAGMIGVAATGGMRATQSLLGPPGVILKGMEAVTPTRVAHAFNVGGFGYGVASVRAIGVRAGPLVLIYCALAAAFAGPLIGLTLGDEYRQYAWLVSVYAVCQALLFFNVVASVILRSAGRTAPIFVAQGVSASVVLTVGIAAVRSYGLKGVGMGLIIDALLINAVLWYFVWRLFRAESLDADRSLS